MSHKQPAEEHRLTTPNVGFKRPDRRILLTAGAYAALSSLLGVYGWIAIQSSWSTYDDEGYLLASLLEAQRGDQPYVDYYLQYGPAWIAAWMGASSLLGVEWTHATGRILTLGVWVITSALVSISTRRFTRSQSAGFASLVLAFFSLQPLIYEPLHPIGLLSLLTALLLFISTMRSSSLARFFSLGLVIGVMLLVKVNIGVLAALGLSYYFALRAPQRMAGTRWFFAVAIALPALWLVRSQPLLVLLFIGSLTSLFITVQRFQLALVEAKQLISTLVGAAFPCLVIVFWWIVEGWSVAGLFDGVVLRPLEHPDIFSLPLNIGGLTLVLSAVGLLAVFVTAAQRSTSTTIIGLVGFAGGQPAVLPSTGAAAINSASKRKRDSAMLMASLAIYLFLGVFPVAGSQIALASLAFVPLFSVSLIAAIQIFVNHKLSLKLRRNPLSRLVIFVSPIAVVSLAMWPNTDVIRSFFTSPPTTINGFEGARLPESTARELEDVSYWIRSNCDILVSDPGLHTLNLVSDVPYPGRTPSTAWYHQLREADEKAIIDDLEVAQRPCLVRDAGTREFWLRGRDPQAKLLDSYLKDSFTTATTIGRYELSVAGPS